MNEATKSCTKGAKGDGLGGRLAGWSGAGIWNAEKRVINGDGNGLNNRIPGTIAPFRAGPGYIAERILDFTRLAMKTICRVKLEPFPPALIVKLQFIDVGGTKSCAGRLIGLKTGVLAKIQIVND